MNDLDLCLEVISRSCQPLRYIRRWISPKPLQIEAWFQRQRTTNRKWSMVYQMVTWPMTSCDPQKCCETVLSGVGYPSNSFASCFPSNESVSSCGRQLEGVARMACWMREYVHARLVSDDDVCLRAGGAVPISARSILAACVRMTSCKALLCVCASSFAISAIAGWRVCVCVWWVDSCWVVLSTMRRHGRVGRRYSGNSHSLDRTNDRDNVAFIRTTHYQSLKANISA